MGMGAIAANRRRSGYSPLSIAPSGWWSPADLATMFQSGTRGAEGTAVSADNDPIGLIYDKSGNNRDLVQATAGKLPLYKTASGVRWIDTDGTDDFLMNSSPGITTYPLSVGFWFYADSLAFSFLFSLSDTGAANSSRFAVYQDGTGKIGIDAREGIGNFSASTTTGTISTGQWCYVVARFISATNRRMAVLFPGDVIEHVQNTTSRNPASLDTLTFGEALHSAVAGGPHNGRFREMWVKYADIQPDGLQLNNATLLQLAYGGVAL